MCKEKQSDERRNWCVFVYPPRVITMHTRWSEIAFLSCTFLHCDVKSIVVRVCIKISLILRLTGYVGRNEYVISSIEESQHYFSFLFFFHLHERKDPICTSHSLFTIIVVFFLSRYYTHGCFYIVFLTAQWAHRLAVRRRLADVFSGCTILALEAHGVCLEGYRI